MKLFVYLYAVFSILQYRSVLCIDDDRTIRPYTIHINQSTLDDIQQRLQYARYPRDMIDVVPWSLGTDINYLHELVDYWRIKYNWRQQESKMNELSQYTTLINGLQVHFVHMRSDTPDNAIPIIIPHGWPGTFLECRNIIPLLTTVYKQYNITFNVVCPSLPGYVFSDESLHGGMTSDIMGDMFNELMLRLGYTQYIASGGDWGGVIVMSMAYRHSTNVKGLHTNFTPVLPPLTKSFSGFFSTVLTNLFPSIFLTNEERSYQDHALAGLWHNTAYLRM